MLVVDDRENPLVGAPSLGAAPTALLEGFAQLGHEQIEVHVVSCGKQRGVIASKLAPNIWYHPLFVPSWAFLRTLHLGPALAVRRLLREKIQPAIVHSQGIEWWCGLTGALSGFPSVLTIHGNIRAILANSILKPRAFWKLQALLGDFAIRRHSGVVCISEHVRRNITPRARKTWLIPNALRKRFLEGSGCVKKRRELPYLLVVGTITENKRPLELLDIFTSLHMAGYRFEVRFIGRLGSGDVYSNAFHSKLVAARRLGFVDHFDHFDEQALIRHFDAADALVHFPREEAFGLVVAEGLSRNLKLFASSIGGIVDIARGVPSVELFGGSDFIGLRSSIAKWLDSGSSRAISSAELMRQRYAPIRVAEQTLGVYRELVA